MKKIKVLLLCANPIDSDQLQLDEEVRSIDNKIRTSEYRDAIELYSAWAVRPADLLEALNRYKPDIVHFSCHGTPTGDILLLSKDGTSKPVSGSTLAALFRTLKDNIRIVVINACFSDIIAQSVVSEIDCAIGMNKEIGDDAARTFAAAFYSALGYGRAVENAFDQGVTALAMEGLSGAAVPRLMARQGADLANLALLVPEDGSPSVPLISRIRIVGSTLQMLAELRCEPGRLFQARAHRINEETIQLAFNLTNPNAADLKIERFYIDLGLYDNVYVRDLRYFLGAAMPNRKYLCELQPAEGRYPCVQTSTRSCQEVCKRDQAAILCSTSPTRGGRPFS